MGTKVYAYYWGFGPLRWAFTENQLNHDRTAIIAHCQETGHMGGVSPVMVKELQELPQEPELRLYVGDF